VVADTWHGVLVAYCYVPKHLLPAALVSPSLVVLPSWAPLMARPFGQVVSQWGPTTWVVDRAQAPQLLADLGADAALIAQVLADVQRVLAGPEG
jgi:hypothetical protein